ncbi:hypothetical protein GY45DRAFT_1329257 [Cubamyces sp. BRFM 1775]|nr:hypothetical protein GY45DRAFT_1329257 [Cubamyces sp. BRFM 1775]
MKYLTQVIICFYPILGLLLAARSGSNSSTSTMTTPSTISPTPLLVGSSACPLNDYTALYGLDDTCLSQESCVCANQATLMKCIHELCTATYASGVQAELAERCATFTESDTAASNQPFTQSDDHMARNLKTAVTCVSVALGLAVLAGIVVFARWLRRRRSSSLVPPFQRPQAFAPNSGCQAVMPISLHRELHVVVDDHPTPTDAPERHARAARRPPSTLGALSLRGRNGSASSTFSLSIDGEGDAVYAEDADIKAGYGWVIPPQLLQAGPETRSYALHRSTSSWRAFLVQRFQSARTHRAGLVTRESREGANGEIDSQSNTTSLEPPPAYDELSDRYV